MHYDTTAITDEVLTDATCSLYYQQHGQLFFLTGDALHIYQLQTATWLNVGTIPPELAENSPQTLPFAGSCELTVSTRDELEQLPHPQDGLLVGLEALAIASVVLITILVFKLLILPLIPRKVQP